METSEVRIPEEPVVSLFQSQKERIRPNQAKKICFKKTALSKDQICIGDYWQFARQHVLDNKNPKPIKTDGICPNVSSDLRMV